MVSNSWDVEEVLSKLELSEKIALVSGVDFWHTFPVRRLGVPSIRLSDGPNGVRGTKFFNGVPAACLPCGTGLAATWDTDLIRRGGALQAQEAVAKGASVILGPTANMQRSPLGGRGFESFSEDPYLAGTISAAAINGIQSTGVAATIKHYVCNDQEHQRQSMNSVLTERALREIYLLPFQIAQRDSKPMCYMTAYNKVNGVHASECPRLLKKILRDEWGFDGMVMSDWFGTYSSANSIKAGLDLEMPGPTYARGKAITQDLGCRKLLDHELDFCVRNMLKLVKKVQHLNIPENAVETTADSPETSALLRKLAGDAIVLLQNRGSILPFDPNKKTAVIGPNARLAAFSGGGSAALSPYYAISPLDGVKDQVKDVEYGLGAIGWKKLPLMSALSKTEDGRPGMMMRVFLEPPSIKGRECIDEVYINSTNCLLVDYTHPKITSDLWYVELVGTFTPEESAEYEFSLSVYGTGKLYVDGALVVDNETEQFGGESFFGAGTREETGSLKMEAGTRYAVRVDFGTGPTIKFKALGATPFGAGGLRVGAERKIDPIKELDKAVEIAKKADQVILCVGLNADWESEGYDRSHMNLPGLSDELVARVCKANPNTAVVMQCGTPVAMPWIKECPALLQAWYGGNETGNAIADVLFGKVNPAGRLPLSFPTRNEDNPAFLNFASERGRTLYGEDIYVGYRFYEKTRREVLFPFGFGLSYTKFEMSDLNVAEKGTDIIVQVTLSNIGERHGAAVIQVYVAQQKPSIGRPVKELKGFAKVSLEAGKSQEVKLSMSKKYAASFWDEDRDAWIMEKDVYEVLVGESSASISLKGEFQVTETVWWNGL